MIKTEELKVTHSTVLSKEGKPFVAVLIERGRDSAEGEIPSCKIKKYRGFLPDEIKELELLLQENKQEIIDAAKGISSLSHLLQ